jgi:hypothetical protein
MLSPSVARANAPISFTGTIVPTWLCWSYF